MIQSTPVRAVDGRDDLVVWPIVVNGKLTSPSGITRAVFICKRDGFDDVTIDSDVSPTAFNFGVSAIVGGRRVNALRWAPGLAVASPGGDHTPITAPLSNVRTYYPGELSISGKTPSFLYGIASPFTMSPYTARLSSFGYGPVLAQTVNTLMTTVVGSLALSGQLAAIAGASASVSTLKGSLAIVGNQCASFQPVSRVPSSGALVMSGKQAVVFGGGGSTAIPFQAADNTDIGVPCYCSSVFTEASGSLTGTNNISGYTVQLISDDGSFFLLALDDTAPDSLISGVSFNDRFGAPISYDFSNIEPGYPALDGTLPVKYWLWTTQSAANAFANGGNYTLTVT